MDLNKILLKILWLSLRVYPYGSLPVAPCAPVKDPKDGGVGRGTPEVQTQKKQIISMRMIY